MTQLEKREAEWLRIVSGLDLEGIVIFTGDALELQLDKHLLHATVARKVTGRLNYPGISAESLHWSNLLNWAERVVSLSYSMATTVVVTQRWDVLQALMEQGKEVPKLTLFRVMLSSVSNAPVVEAGIEKESLGKMLQRDMEVR